MIGTKKKNKNYTPPTWYLLEGDVVTKIDKQGGAKLVLSMYPREDKIFRPIFYDSKRNIIIATREK